MKRLFSILVGCGGLLVALMLPAVPAHAANTCVWTGTTNNFWNTSTNWSGCGGTVPQNGDNLSFDKTSLSGAKFLTNNIPSLQIGSITFSGSNSFFFISSGNAITIANGITDNSSGSPDQLTMTINLSADQAFTGSAGGGLDLSSSGHPINIGAHTLSINGSVHTEDAIVGTGGLNFASSSAFMFLNGDSPNLSAPIHINSGRLIINSAQATPLGSGPVTIADGGILQQSTNAFGTYTIANDITMIGDGGGGNGAINLHAFSGSDGSTTNFTGAITLLGNAFIDLDGNNANFVNTPAGCGFSIAQSSGSTGGNLLGNLTGSCPVDPVVTSGSKPAAPSTGDGQPGSRSAMSLLMVLSAACLLAGANLLAKKPGSV